MTAEALRAQARRKSRGALATLFRTGLTRPRAHDEFVGTSRITYRMEPSRPSPPATSPATSPRPTTCMADLSVDALAHCADYLSLHDVFRLAISSKFLRTVAYSDSVWLRLFRFCSSSYPGWMIAWTESVY